MLKKHENKVEFKTQKPEQMQKNSEEEKQEEYPISYICSKHLMVQRMYGILISLHQFFNYWWKFSISNMHMWVCVCVWVFVCVCVCVCGSLNQKSLPLAQWH